jgi:hypothetical protein
MFYVYILSNPTTLIPFYVGVGKENRHSNVTREQQHLLDAKKLMEGKKLHKPNLHKLRTIIKIFNQNLEPTIDIVARFESEKDAFVEEIRLIRYYGRADLGLGPLTNLTDGGEGGVNPAAETRRKISARLKGKPSHLKGKKTGPYLPERGQKISKSLKGRPSPRKGKPSGHTAWNKGLTKDTSESVAKYSKPNPAKGFKKGSTPTNKGKAYVVDQQGTQLCVPKDDPRIISGELVSIHSGRPGWNSGKTLKTKGKTYEEIYGPEKAQELRELRRQVSLNRWQKNNSKQ